MSYQDMLTTLAKQGIIVIKKQLMRILRACGLYRLRYANFEDAIDFIVGQFEGPGKHCGYHWYLKQVQCTPCYKEKGWSVVLALCIYTYFRAWINQNMQTNCISCTRNSILSTQCSKTWPQNIFFSLCGHSGASYLRNITTKSPDNS